MCKFYKYLIFLLIIFHTNFSNAHVQHYYKLNRVEFDIYRNNNHIGTHIFTFSRTNEILDVESEINFEIKKLGLVIYKYHVKGTETYKEGKLVSFKSKTLQNKKEKYVNLKLIDNEFLIDGSSFKGKTPTDYLIGTWWNHSLVKAKAQISAVSGRIIEQKVVFLGKDVISFSDNTYNALHFNFSSTDESLSKDKKLNTDVWYDEETLIWVKATFKKKGNWEYKLRLVE